MRWVGVDGWSVEAIRLDGRQVLRVRHRGYHVAYCTSVGEVSALVDLASLVEFAELGTLDRHSV
ncbi:transposase [Streptosporangium sp. KLBMP 9127]|nr:transposase [Streptosporangium sp. KLBMP 9127]